MKKTTRRLPLQHVPASKPWSSLDWEDEDGYAIQAVMMGHASEAQQRRAMQFVIHNICGTYDLEFRPGGEEGRRASDFAAGRRFVGLQLVKFAHLNIAQLRGKQTEQGEAPKEQG